MTGNFYSVVEKLLLIYFKVSGGVEIDLLVELSKRTLSRPQQLVALEIKNSKNWDKRWSENLIEIQKINKNIKKLIGVYRGKKAIHFQQVSVYPVEEFLLKLNAGDFF